MRHAARRLFARVLDAAGGGLRTIERRARIFTDGVVTPFPFQANLHGLPPAVVAECLRGFIAATPTISASFASANSDTPRKNSSAVPCFGAAAIGTSSGCW